MTITIGYTERYLGWTGSHASPQRARLAVEHILARTEDDGIAVTMLEPQLDQDHARDCLSLVHHADYLKRQMKGEQGKIATLMFLGTEILVRQIEQDGFKPQVYFNPQGAKHHAAFRNASGFCWFNDHAWAAQYFAAQGMRVAYLDWDAHHGDGVEDLTRDNPNILTASIHEWGIFPGTGKRTSHKNRTYNYPLDAGDGDAELLEAVEDALYAIRDFDPQIILLACGADGLRQDPLAGLTYTIEHGIIPAAHAVGQLAYELGVPVLVGGAGGYTPYTYVPVAWAETILAIHEELEGRSTLTAWHTATEEVAEPAYEDAPWDDRQDDTRARKQAILDDLKDYPVLEWENLLTREEFEIVQAEITPQIMAAMEAATGATPSRKQARNTKRRAAKKG